MNGLASQHCELPDCFVPETSCAEGHMDAKNCPHSSGHETNSSDSEVGDDDESFPWTGRPLGVTDVRFISASFRPQLIGIAGAADAGKTTLLSLLYLAYSKGHCVGGRAFSGSYSLLGWENISRYMQLNAGDAVRFPAHTSSAGRSPGLLHLEVSNKEGGTCHTLITDASGEWFSAWADKPNDTRAAGARWIAGHADRLMIIADTEALTGTERGQARRSLEFLMRRAHSEFGENGVALVWTKVDKHRPTSLKQQIEQHFKSCFGSAPIFEISIPSVEGADETLTLRRLDEIFSWAFNKRVRRVIPPKSSVRSADPFLAFREKSPHDN